MNLLVVAQQPGDANVLVTTLKKLNSHCDSIFCIANANCEYIFNNNGYQTYKVELSEDEILNKRIAITFIEQQKIDFILTGTCGDLQKNLNRAFISAAKEMLIPSIGLLDAWNGLGSRFSKGEEKTYYLPDLLAVPDTLSKDILLREGFPDDRIEIVGHVYLDYLLSNIKCQYYKKKKVTIRQNNNIPLDIIWIIFFSQPISNLYGDKDSNNLGYDEFFIINKLIDSLTKITSSIDKRVVLTIQNHPREHIDKYIPFSFNKRNLVVTTVKNRLNIEDLSATNLIIGMNSNILLESFICGFPVLSLEIGLKTNSSLLSNIMGWNAHITKDGELSMYLTNFLKETHYENRNIGEARKYLSLDGKTHNRIKKLMVALKEKYAS